MKYFKLHSIVFLFALTSCLQTNQQLVLLEDNPKLNLTNGVLLYNNSPFDGMVESYYGFKKIKSQSYYSEGRKEGSETFWYENDSLASKRVYSNGIKVGIHKAWWQNGNPRFVYCFNDKGEYHGDVKEWYETGELFRDFNFENGREVGRQRLWYQNKKIKANYEVVDGERFGLIGLKKCYTVTSDSNEIK